MAPSLFERLRRLTAAYEFKQQQQQQQQQQPASASASASAPASAGKTPPGSAGAAPHPQKLVFNMGASSAASGSGCSAAYRWPDANDYSSAEAHPHARHQRTRSLDELPAVPRAPVEIPLPPASGCSAGAAPAH